MSISKQFSFTYIQKKRARKHKRARIAAIDTGDTQEQSERASAQKKRISDGNAARAES